MYRGQNCLLLHISSHIDIRGQPLKLIIIPLTPPQMHSEDAADVDTPMANAPARCAVSFRL